MAKNKTAQILAAVVCASTVLTLSPVHNAFAANDNTGVVLNVTKGNSGVFISVAGNNNPSVLLGNDGDVGVNSINGVEVKTDANGNIILNTTAKPDTVFNLNSMQSNLNNLANAGIAPGWIKTDEQIKQSGFMEQIKDSLAGGKNGVAIGADSYAGRSGIAIGTGANKSAGIGARRGAISIGSDSNSKGLYSTVIGTKAELNDDPKQSIKISGQTQTVQGAAATVIGSYNKVETKSQDRAFASVGNNIIGAANTVTDSNGIAIQGSGNTITNAYKNMDVSKANISEILKGDFSSVLEQESGEVAVIGGNNTITNTTATTQIGSGTNITDSEGVFTVGKKNTLNKVQNSVVIGNNITVTDVKNAIAIGNVKEVGSNNSIVMGSDSNIGAKSGQSVAIGYKSTVTNSSGSVAIGQEATVDMSNTSVVGNGRGPWNGIAIGNNSKTIDSYNGVTIGAYSDITNSNNSVAVGPGLTVKNSAESTTMGHTSHTENSNGAVVIGNGYILNNNGTLENHYNEAIGSENAVVIGHSNSIKNAESAIALGDTASVSGSKGIAIGFNSKVTEVFGTALGGNSEAVANATALGADSKATAAGSVALGSSSEAKEMNTVSVGSEYIKRKITNVKAGVNDYDAVNVSQLNEVKNSKFTVNLAQPDGSTQKIEKGIGESINITGKNANILSSYNEANNAVSVDLNKNLVDMQSINNNQVKFNQDKSTTFADKVTVKADGKISGLTAGTADNEAVNVGQLNEVKAQAGKHTTLTTNDGNVGLTKTETDGQLNYDVALNKNLKDIESVNGLKFGDFDGAFTTLSTNDKNVTGNVKIYSDGGIYADGAISSNKDVITYENGNVKYSLNTIGNNTQKITYADGITSIAGTTSLAGKVTVGTDGKISGVTAGEISATSTEAVNGSQLNDIKTLAGKHTTLTTTGEDSNIIVTETNKDNQLNYDVKLNDKLTDIESINDVKIAKDRNDNIMLDDINVSDINNKTQHIKHNEGDFFFEKENTQVEKAKFYTDGSAKLNEGFKVDKDGNIDAHHLNITNEKAQIGYGGIDVTGSYLETDSTITVTATGVVSKYNNADINNSVAVNKDGVQITFNDKRYATTSSLKVNKQGTTFENDGTGTTLIDGKKITAGSIKVNAEAGSTITGLSNTSWNGTTDDSSRVATEGQLQNIYDTASKQHSIVEAGDNIVVNSSENADGANVYTVSVAKDIKVNSIKATGDIATENYSINANGEEIDKLHSAGIVAGNAYSSNGIAIGEGSKSWATNSMAIGQNSSAEQIGSVAIGYGSKTDRANSVSFGSVGNERVLTNIAAGEKSTDAVNKAQLDAVATQAGKSTSVIGSDNINVAKDVDGSITKYTVSLKNNVKLSDENGYTTISLSGDDGSASFANGKVNINADGSVTGLGFSLAETGASFKYGNSSVSFGADGAKFTNAVGSTTINGNAIATGSVTANSITGLANKTWDANNITSGQAATEDQVKQAVDNVSTQVDNKVGDLNNLNEAIKGNNVVESLNKLDNKVGNLNDLHSDIKGSSVVDSINKVDDKITNVSGNVDKVTEKTTDITYDKATGTTTVGGSKFKDGNISTGNIKADGDVTTKDGASLNTINKNVGDLTKFDKEITENDKYKNNQNVVGGINAEADIRKNEVSRLDNRVDVLDGRVGSLENRVANVEERIDKVGAMSAAIANLRTMGYDPEAPTELAIGIGQYKSETGLALGLFHYPNQDFMLSASISTSGDEVMGGIGATWKLGRKTPEQRAQIEARHKAEKAEALKLAAKQAEVKAQAERHAKLAQERHNQQVKEA